MRRTKASQNYILSSSGGKIKTQQQSCRGCACLALLLPKPTHSMARPAKSIDQSRRAAVGTRSIAVCSYLNYSIVNIDKMRTQNMTHWTSRARVQRNVLVNLGGDDSITQEVVRCV